MGRILVIRGGAIGDFILTLPAIRLLREGFPTCHLEVMAYRRVLPLIERRFYADAGRCIEYGPLARCFNPKVAMAEEMAAYFLAFDQIVSYLYDPDRLFHTSLERVGVKNYLPISPHISPGKHAAHHLAEPLASLALFLDAPHAKFHPTEEDQASGDCLIAGLSKRWVAIHPGSGSSKKNWPRDRWENVILKTREARGANAVAIIGGEADSDTLQHLRSTFGPSLRVFENQPLNILGAALSRCSLFLGHDSGISHLAVASGAPSILLFGPTDPDTWAPIGDRVHIVRAPGGCLAAIAVEQFMEEISKTQWFDPA
ncbi:MAG: glycosyltransferase family 9 protein [Terrimicrobiaceae bacterium]